MQRKFKDRTDAGRQLADKLREHELLRPLVLALPRGGVPVGYEVAKAFAAPLDTIVVRKIGAPADRELGVGAIAPGDIMLFNTRLLGSLGIAREEIDPVIEEETREMERRMLHYRSGEYCKDAPADEIIIVDDGLATGFTARAAIESALTRFKPRTLIFAAPICARDTADDLRKVIEVVCVQSVADLRAIGNWYEDFSQTTDEEVVELLERARSEHRGYAK